MHPTAKVWTSE